MHRTILILVAALVVGVPGAAIGASKITSRDIKDGTIKLRDISKRAKHHLHGARGLIGPQGPQGPQGPAGPVNVGALVRVSAHKSVPAGSIDSVAAVCPRGYGVVTGGFAGITGNGNVFYSDSLGSRTSWSVGLDNFSSTSAGDLYAVAFCAPAGRAVIATVSRTQDRARELVERQRSMHG